MASLEQSKESRNILITGGSSGIGIELVRLFYHDGFNVWFTYRSGKSQAAALVEELRSPASSATLTALKWDAADRQSLEKLAAALPERLDVLINNAGVGTATVKKLSDDPYEQDRFMMMVNAVAPLWLVRKVLPGMKKHGGRIINISSVGGGITQFPNFTTADGMSKAALAFMSRQLSAELTQDPVDVFAICPGAVETPMFSASTLDHLDAEERRQLIRNLPGGRLIEPLEIARIARFLCTPAGSVLRGAVLDASLGLGSNPGQLQAK
ncbi:MAG: SDR family NAD(P)-dependent oxidoreductase [Cyclonatronaceae bacterium]